MKIGILTFHRALNYGAVLQCYALFKTLTEMGHDVEVIDYRPKAIEKYRLYFRWKDFVSRGMMGKLRYIASSLVLCRSKHKTARKFDEFLTSNLKFSCVVNKPEEIPSYYDVVFFGSDQIWNPEICEGLDKVYYGQFCKDRTKFIGYAASLGRQELIKGKTAELFKKYLDAYDVIGVRELPLQDFLKTQYNKDTTMVCDPSLLLSKEQSEKIAIKPKDENFVVVFSLDDNPNAVPFAERIAKQLGANVLMLKAETNHLHKYPCEIRSELSPAEFLGYIKYAQCIVTNSFHATSFSIIMQKDFYTLKRDTNNDRSKTILSVAGLENRFIDAKENIQFVKIEKYKDVPQRLSSYIQESLGFIKNNI